MGLIHCNLWKMYIFCNFLKHETLGKVGIKLKHENLSFWKSQKERKLRKEDLALYVLI